MSMSLLDFAPSAQNTRVSGFEVPGDEQPRQYSTEAMLSSTDLDQLIHAAYLQIFHPQQMLVSTRQTFLESQLRIGQISVKEFIYGLATSDTFRRLNYEVNNNYRFVELCIQRLLGRQVYNDRETLSWSIVLATQGLNGFVSALLNSDEYAQAFGENTVPYQRRRILPQRSQGELPFERMARYGTDYRDALPRPTGRFDFNQPFEFQRFIETTNWSRVALLLLCGTGLILFLLGFSTISGVG
jgi:phycobilisome rod-core linker protein